MLFRSGGTVGLQSIAHWGSLTLEVQGSWMPLRRRETQYTILVPTSQQSSYREFVDGWSFGGDASWHFNDAMALTVRAKQTWATSGEAGRRQWGDSSQTIQTRTYVLAWTIRP